MASMANDAYSEHTPLLQACLRGYVEDIHAMDGSEPDPVGSLRARFLRSAMRDLDRVGLAPTLSSRISKMAVSAIRRVLDDPGVTLDDKTASALIAERVMCGVVAAVLQFQADEGTLRHTAAEG